MTRIYQALLRLYPLDYRTRFAAEMLETFEEADANHRGQGLLRSFRFRLTEMSALLTGAICEWIAKLSADAAVRGRCLPDLRMMRPPGVTKELWFGQGPKSRRLPTVE